MFIQLTKEQLQLIRTTISVSLPHLTDAKIIVQDIDARLAEAFDPENDQWIQRAREIHQEDGVCEIDDQSDGSAMISHSDEGAYVLAWAWVDNNEAKGE
jgi:hypothetical protein